MAESEQTHEIELVECEVCLKEIPVSEATSEEVSDYVTYYCGLDCYEKWKKQLAEHSAKEK